MLVRHRSLAAPTIDRAFEQLTNSFYETRRSAGPVVDGRWDDDEYIITVDLPGVPASAVTVEMTGTTLALAAETDSLTWHRSLKLGGRLDPDKVSARHVDGRLTVRVGTIDEPEARAISIDTTAPAEPDAIEASSNDDQSIDTNAGE